jgi:DNA-binding transcriptional LysR family regulator
MSTGVALDAQGPATSPRLLTVVEHEPIEPAVAAALDLSPRLLRCFVTVAEELHFGRAADRLYIAQPALSRSIQQLERLLGRCLFVRTTRSVKPTEHAKRLMPVAREVLEALNELAGEVRSDDRLRVAHVPCSDTAALLLDGFARVMPTVRVEELTLNASEQLAALRDGRIDVALCRAPFTSEARLQSRLVRLDCAAYELRSAVRAGRVWVTGSRAAVRRPRPRAGTAGLPRNFGHRRRGLQIYSWTSDQ